ncbi:MAG: cell division protein FtsH, partial [Kocuria sp.]|nr:cell division protein FtsH [Kocuria sp.]
YALGGRAAEEIVFHDPSTGAANDIDKATGTARKMVTEYGMSSVIGSVKLGSGNSEPFMGRDAGSSGPEYSDELAAKIDAEVRTLIDSAHDEAYEILTENRDVLDRLAFELLDRETLNEREIAEIFKDVRKRPLRDVWLSKETRPVSSMPPITTPAEKEEAAEAGAEDPETMAPQDQAVAAKPEHPLEVPENSSGAVPPENGPQPGPGEPGSDEPGQGPAGRPKPDDGTSGDQA